MVFILSILNYRHYNIVLYSGNLKNKIHAIPDYLRINLKRYGFKNRDWVTTVQNKINFWFIGFQSPINTVSGSVSKNQVTHLLYYIFKTLSKAIASALAAALLIWHQRACPPTPRDFYMWTDSTLKRLPGWTRTNRTLI